MTVSIRPAAGSGDAAAIAAVYAHYVDNGYATFETAPPDAAEFEQRMRAAPRLPWLVAEERGTVLGFAYASRHRERAAYRWSADVSVYLAPGASGRGIGRALYSQLIAQVAALGYVSLFAGVALPNPASVRLHESMGFTAIGVYRNVGFKLGGWRDVGWWQLRLQDPPPPDPPEPRAWRVGDDLSPIG